MSNSEQVFITVMGLQEAKNHQIKLKAKGVSLNLKTNSQTCSRGCKVTVELWGDAADQELLQEYFSSDLLRSLDADKINFEALNAVYDPSSVEVTCQACAFKFAPHLSECPDCGLCYSL